MLGELQDALDLVEATAAVACWWSRRRRQFLVRLRSQGADGGAASGAEQWREILDRDFNAVKRFWSLKKPTIAAVNGYWPRRGCELALCCDMTIAADDAIFGEPELKFGAGIVVMICLAGRPKRAKEILLTGADRIPAQEALDIG